MLIKIINQNKPNNEKETKKTISSREKDNKDIQPSTY